MAPPGVKDILKISPTTRRIIPLLVALALVGPVLLAWSGYKVWRRGSADLEAVPMPRPEAVTVIDCQNMSLKVPAPFELTFLSAQAAGPGDSYLDFEEKIFADRNRARREMDRDIAGLKAPEGQCSAAAVVMFKPLGRVQTLSCPHLDYLASTGHGWLTVHHLGRRLERPAVLVMEYGHLSHPEDLKHLHPRLYILWDRSFLKIQNRNFGRLEIEGISAAPPAELGERLASASSASSGERERFLALADDFLKDLGRGDFQGRDGGLSALNRLSADPGAAFEVWLDTAVFQAPAEADGILAPRPWVFRIEREAGSLRTRPRVYFSELLFPWDRRNQFQETRRPLIVGGRPGQEIVTRRLYSSLFTPQFTFVWEDAVPAGRNDYFRKFHLSGDDESLAPAMLGRWRWILETAGFGGVSRP